MAFVCLIQIHLHLPENGSLKGKRREVTALKSQLQRRFGASVSETDHHELWQRATISAALVGSEPGRLSDAAARLERYVESRFPDGVWLERGLASKEELLGG
jgi:uncharacterized protein YlxP (DUF503 family)